jgi:hypothetical protein
MKKRLFATFLALGMLALAGCELITVDRDKDRAQIVARFGDTTITKGELYDAATADLAYEGYDIDLWDENMGAELRASTNDYLAAYLENYAEVALIKAVGARDYPITEEEEATLAEQSASYIAVIKMILGYDEQNPEAYQGDIEKDVDDYLAMQGTSRAKMDDMGRTNLLYSKVKEALTEGIEANEDQARARHEKDLASQKAAYADGGRKAYETATTLSSLGDYALYKAPGYAVVKHILLAYTEQEGLRREVAQEDVDDAISERDAVKKLHDDAKAKADAAQNEVTTAQAALALARQNNDVDAMTNAQAAIDANNAILNAQTAEMNAQQALLPNMEANVAAAEQALTALEKSLLAAHQGDVDAVMARLEAGEAFEALMDEFNEDGGADRGSMPGLGYLVSPDNTLYAPEFAAAALGMTARAQVSAPVMTTFGVHILYMVYTPDEEADIDYEIVKSAVKAQEDATVVEAAWAERIETLKEENGLKLWPRRARFIR